MNFNSINKDQLIELFEQTFLVRYNTCLKSGFDEPLYLPSNGTEPAQVCFRADYLSSALHEIAHWCIAGEERRRKEDYGYWYEPDGRSESRQQAFELVEIKPQALEWIFSIAAGVTFHISADNLSVDSASTAFMDSVIAQAKYYIEKGLPERAALFYDGLNRNKRYGRSIQSNDFTR